MRYPGRPCVPACERITRVVRRSVPVGCWLVLSLVLAECGSDSTRTDSSTSAGGLQVVVAENFWGSIVKQEAGRAAHVMNIITNPNADPHSYEPTTADARAIADARYFVFNGVGYDSWATKLLGGNPVSGRRVLNVGDAVGKREGDNPHMWYSPSYVRRVADRVTSDLKRLDSTHAAYYDRRHTAFVKTGLRSYLNEIALIGQRYGAVPVGATESIFVYLASALRLKLISPADYMKALSEGTEPTARDKVTFDDQVTHRKIKVLVVNPQNSTPDTAALETKATSAGIPIVRFTETLSPSSVSFQTWQLDQLRALSRALAASTGH